MGTTKPNQSAPKATAKAPAVKDAAKSEPSSTTRTHELPARRAERRPDLIKKRREELRQRPEKKQKQKLYTRIGLGVLAVIIVGGIGFSIYQWQKDRDLNTMPDGVITYTDAVWTARNHDDNYNGWPDLDKHPPVGGTHNQIWQNCEYYDKTLLNGHAVHSLEHGAVWITYKPDLPQDQIDKLKALAKDQTYILVSPYADQPTPVVATAWDHQLDLQSADSKDLDRFIKIFKNNAKYTPEFGASCTGGTSDVAPQ